MLNNIKMHTSYWELCHSRDRNLYGSLLLIKKTKQFDFHLQNIKVVKIFNKQSKEDALYFIT